MIKEYEDKIYKLNELPRGHCFSNNKTQGSYYEDTEPGERKSYHKYNENGELIFSSICPPEADYYLSDAKGNRLQGIPKWQYICYDNNNNYKVTNSRYKTKEDAQAARQTSRWIVSHRIIESVKRYIVIPQYEWQWTWQADNSYFCMTSDYYSDPAHIGQYTYKYTKFEPSKRLVQGK